MARLLSLALLVVATLLLPRGSTAHEASLGVLELREMRPGIFIGLWTMEPTIGAERGDLKVPPHCYLRLP